MSILTVTHKGVTVSGPNITDAIERQIFIDDALDTINKRTNPNPTGVLTGVLTGANIAAILEHSNYNPYKDIAVRVTSRNGIVEPKPAPKPSPFSFKELHKFFNKPEPKEPIAVGDYVEFIYPIARNEGKVFKVAQVKDTFYSIVYYENGYILNISKDAVRKAKKPEPKTPDFVIGDYIALVNPSKENNGKTFEVIEVIPDKVVIKYQTGKATIPNAQVIKVPKPEPVKPAEPVKGVCPFKLGDRVTIKYRMADEPAAGKVYKVSQMYSNSPNFVYIKFNGKPKLMSVENLITAPKKVKKVKTDLTHFMEFYTHFKMNVEAIQGVSLSGSYRAIRLKDGKTLAYFNYDGSFNCF